MSLSHKAINEFIRKYNNQFAIKGYSRLNIADKNKLVEKRVKEVGGKALMEYNSLTGKKQPKVSEKEFTKARKKLKEATFKPIQTEPEDLSKFTFVSRSKGMTLEKAIEKALKDAEDKGDVKDNLQILNNERKKKGLKPLTKKQMEEIIARFKK